MSEYKILVVSAGISRINLISAISGTEVDFGIRTEYDTLLCELKALREKVIEFQVVTAIK